MQVFPLILRACRAEIVRHLNPGSRPRIRRAICNACAQRAVQAEKFHDSSIRRSGGAWRIQIASHPGNCASFDTGVSLKGIGR